MKTKHLLSNLLMLIVLFCSSNRALSQATSSGPANPNIPVAGPNYLGWAFGVGLQLGIKTEDPRWA